MEADADEPTLRRDLDVDASLPRRLRAGAGQQRPDARRVGRGLRVALVAQLAEDRPSTTGHGPRSVGELCRGRLEHLGQRSDQESVELLTPWLEPRSTVVGDELIEEREGGGVESDIGHRSDRT